MDYVDTYTETALEVQAFLNAEMDKLDRAEQDRLDEMFHELCEEYRAEEEAHAIMRLEYFDLTGRKL